MNFLKVFPKEEKNLKCACKRWVLQQSCRPATSIKRDSNTCIFL